MIVWVRSRYYENLYSKVRQCKYKAEDQAIRAYYNLRQTPEMSCQECFERVKNIVEVIKSIGGSLVDHMHLEDELPVQPAGGYTTQQYKIARETILNKKIAYGILVRVDLGRYGKLIEEVENSPGRDWDVPAGLAGFERQNCFDGQSVAEIDFVYRLGAM